MCATVRLVVVAYAFESAGVTVTEPPAGASSSRMNVIVSSPDVPRLSTDVTIACSGGVVSDAPKL